MSNGSGKHRASYPFAGVAILKVVTFAYLNKVPEVLSLIVAQCVVESFGKLVIEFGGLLLKSFCEKLLHLL
jgi:hypothetical protein